MDTDLRSPFGDVLPAPLLPQLLLVLQPYPFIVTISGPTASCQHIPLVA